MLIFNGSSVSANIIDNNNYYSIKLDGNFLDKPILTDNRANATYQLVDNLDTSKLHTITLSKRTEPFVGPIATFRGYSINNGPLIVKPNPYKTDRRRIEVWGDSMTCGYGDLGTSPNCGFSADTEDIDYAWGHVTARTFNADVSILAWSGKGVVRNYGDPNQASPDPMPIYLPSNTALNLNNKYDWSWIPDVVAIALGGNDYNTQPYPDSNVWIAAYINVTNLVRNNYGKTIPIFSSCGPLVNGDPLCSNVQTVVKTLNSQGDPNVYYVDMQNILVFPDDYGCDYHPSVSGQQKMADKLIAAIKSVLGW